MTDTQQILKAIQDVEKRLDEKLDQKLEPIKNQLDSQGKILESHSKQFDTVNKKLDNLTSETSHLKTASEAIIAGLTEVTKAVKSDKEVKIRLKNLEEHTGTTNPIKN